MDINFSNWEVDCTLGVARHDSGAALRFRGHPDSDNFEGYIEFLPNNLSALDKARLLRHGFEAYRAAFAARPDAPRRRPLSQRRPRVEVV